MRKVTAIAFAIAGAALAGLASLAGTPPHASAATRQNGEWIVRCTMTGEVQAVDPIMNPGGTAPHVHMFFGNANGTAGVTSHSTYAQLHSASNQAHTTCQDTKDTAAYWAPESFLNGKPYLPGCRKLANGSGNYACGSSPASTIYIRAYYLTGSGSRTKQLPPGLVMVAGTPDATSPPSSDKVVEWDCGANTVRQAGGQTIQVQSPESIWPYDCAPYQHDPRLNSEGLVEIINFPSCFDGRRSFPSPNGPGPNGEAKVPAYFDPSLHMPVSNDLAYAPCGGKFDQPIPKVSMRIHYLNLWHVAGSRPVLPSSCQQAAHLAEACSSQPKAPASLAFKLSSTQTKGAPGPWYTEHADYWQTWQQGKALGPDPNSGTLNSLTYYCLDHAVTCGFMPSTRKGRPAFPPPPG